MLSYALITFCFASVIPIICGSPSLGASSQSSTSVQATIPLSGKTESVQSSARETESAPDPALMPAKASVAQGDLAKAESLTRQFLRDHQQSADGHFLLGFILFREISAKWLESGRATPQRDNLLYSRSDADGVVAQFRDAKARESLAEFTAGARFAVPSAFDLKIVALDYILLKDYVDADQWLTRALQKNPRDAQAWYYLGRTKYSESQFAEAIEAYQACLKLEPHNISAETNVGLSYEAMAQRDQARQAFENAIAWEKESTAKDPEPFIELAHLFLDQNQPDKAVSPLLEAIAIAPNVSTAHEELGRAYSLLHRLPESQAELEKAVALDPDAASLHCLLGQVYRQEKLLDKAVAEFDRCSALQQASPTKTPGTQ